MPKLNKGKEHHIYPNRSVWWVTHVVEPLPNSSLIPDEAIAEEINTSRTYKAYKDATIYKVIEVKWSLEWMPLYNWLDAVGFIELTEAVVYLHDRIKKNPEKRYDILPM